METFLIKTVQLLLSLSILVIFHEFGHFIFARMFKVRVEKFYLFFDPWFSLFKFKPKNSYTEYGIGWLPFGGYVKISGMIDESMDREQMSQPPKPWEFRSKPAWQRLLIMVAGRCSLVFLYRCSSALRVRFPIRHNDGRCCSTSKKCRSRSRVCLRDGSSAIPLRGRG